MESYDVTCPCCGHKNNDLYLYETEGWMECEKCGEVRQVSKRFMRPRLLPVFRMDELDKLERYLAFQR